jgi:hypothetical protein
MQWSVSVWTGWRWKGGRTAVAHRLDILAKKDGECWYCGKDLTGLSWHVEHMTPHCRGGSDNYANLVPSCARCNIAKGRRTVDEYKDALRLTPANLIRKAAALINSNRAAIPGSCREQRPSVSEYDLVESCLKLADLVESRDIYFGHETDEPPFDPNWTPE